MHRVGKAIAIVAKAAWIAFVIATPILGAWVASSMAAYSNRPLWTSAVAALLAFPVLPLAWEAIGEWRWRRAGRKKRFLTRVDRVTLRTLAVNVVFMGGMLAAAPERAFAALSTRGDWMLDGRDGPKIATVRRALFRAAGELEWMYVASRDNPFRDPSPTTATTSTSTATSTSTSTAIANAPWPIAATLHPLVVAMKPEAETSVDAVAKAIADGEPDPFLRIKAVHDWVADRIAYDAEAYAARKYPPQDAATVFASRKAVCAGYAALFDAMSRAAGIEAAFVGGDARTARMSEKGEGHAWNAVKLGDRWWLLDATWDSGSVSGTEFKKGYRTDYFFTPPDVFSVDHLPDDPKWQLRDAPLTRGDFLRQPMTSPAFFADSLELVAPTRSQVTVGRALDVEIKNPKKKRVYVALAPKGDRTLRDCTTSGDDVVRARCDFGAPGSYEVLLFSGDPSATTSRYVGQIEANSG